MFIRVNNEMQ